MTESTLNQLIIITQARMNAVIDDKADALKEYYANWPYNYENTRVDDLSMVIQMLKRKGYSAYGNLYTKGFICIELISTNKVLELVKIWMDIPGVQNKPQLITESFVTGTIIASNYYERI